MASEFKVSLPTGFHTTISKHIKKGVKVGDKTIFDLQTIFLRLLTIGQQRQMELAPIFHYELCPVPPSLIDEYGHLRKGSKAPLAHKLCVTTLHPSPPDITIIDMSQLLYRIVWPLKANAPAIVESINTKLSHIPGEKVLLFYKYHDISAKDHERMRRAGLGSINYDLTVNTPLPSREVLMRNKHNKLQLSKVQIPSTLGEGVTVESCTNGGFNHDEADITMISYVLMTAESNTQVIRILSVDTDVFILLVYWYIETTSRPQSRWSGGME